MSGPPFFVLASPVLSARLQLPYTGIVMMTPAPGRPKDDGIDRALEGAVADIIASGDTGDLTVRRLATRAGVTRDAFYRRFSGIGHFLISIALGRYRSDPTTDTGTLEGDLLALQREQVEMFTDPTAKRLLPLLLQSVASDSTASKAFAERFLAPRREAFVRMVDRAVERGEIAPVQDYDAMLTLVAGPMIMRALLPVTGPLDDAFARQTAAAVVAVLRQTPTGDTD